MRLWGEIMWRVIFSTYRKNRIGILRAVPWSFMVSRIITGVTQIIFPYFMYHYFIRGNLNSEFHEYTNGADYMTYIVLGAALNVLAVSTLMNIGRALITELREGTLETLLMTPMSRAAYFAGCLLEQTTRALLEFGVVMAVGALAGADLRYLFSVPAITAVLLAVLSFFCMGITLSAVMLHTRDTYLTQNTLFIAMNLVCGIMYPIQYLPTVLQRAAQIFPLTPAVSLFRNVVIEHQSLLGNEGLILQIVLLSGVYLMIGTVWYKRMEPKLLESVFG